MVQSFNLQGIKYTFYTLLRPRLLIPHIKVNQINEIDFKSLYNVGIRGMIFDKDNCLTAPYESSLHPPFEDSWKTCLETFGHSNVKILSNSAGTNDDIDYKEAAIIKSALGVEVLCHTQKKPGGGKEVLDMIRKEWGVGPEAVAMVGDRLLTDVLFGNLNGMLSIWTKQTISLKRDNFMASKIRSLEHIFHDSFLIKGMSPSFHPAASNPSNKP